MHSTLYDLHLALKGQNWFIRSLASVGLALVALALYIAYSPEAEHPET